MGLYKAYANLRLECKHYCNVTDHTNKQWFMNAVISSLVPEKTNTVKKHKI